MTRITNWYGINNKILKNRIIRFDFFNWPSFIELQIRYNFCFSYMIFRKPWSKEKSNPIPTIHNEHPFLLLAAITSVLSCRFSSNHSRCWNLKLTARARITRVFYRNLIITADCAFGHACRSVFATLLILKASKSKC